MEEITKALGSVVNGLSDQNYAQSLAFYRSWIDIAQTYHQIPPGTIFDAIWENRTRGSTRVPRDGQVIHSTAHLIPRLASDAELDHILAPYSSGLQRCLCTRVLREFFTNNLRLTRSEKQSLVYFHAEANLIAHWINLGHVEEVAIRDHILQSLISHPKLHDHQADALIILFKLAGATFEAYADPSVVDRCFELLNSHNYLRPYYRNDTYYIRSSQSSVNQECENDNSKYIRVKRELLQVRVAW